MASDASESGFGISSSWWPREVVSLVGRTSERSRCKRLPGGSARCHALEAAGFEFQEGKWSPSGLGPDFQEAEFGEWAVDS